MNFSQALEQLKLGKRLSRRIEHSFGTVVLMPGYPNGIEPNEATLKAFPGIAGTSVYVSSYFMKYANYNLTHWMPTLFDILAEDWYVED